VGAKPTSTRVTTFVPPEVAEVLREWAKSENRTISNLTATILLNAAETRQTNQKDKTVSRDVT
jgi:CopG-like RHH_1 or ribbon-helix-helix domain, RHH_5